MDRWMDRMVLGNPVPDKLVVLYNAASWAFGFCLAGIYFVGDLIGPYKGLYCCIKETRYRAYAVTPSFLVTISAVCLMAHFYWQAYIYIKKSEGKRSQAAGEGEKASTLILRRGITLVSCFYICWAVMLTNGFITSVGGQVHPGYDILAAWTAKLLPIVDSVLLMQMLSRILEKDMKKKKQAAITSVAHSN